MMRPFLSAFFVCIGSFLFNQLHAQPPAVIRIAAACSESRLKKNLYYLASDAMEGRLIATKGDTLASRFIAAQFKAAKLEAPYKNDYFQPVTANQKQIEASLQLGGKVYQRYDGWSVYPQTVVNLKNIPVLYNHFTDIGSVSRYIMTHDVEGEAIVVTNAAMRKATDDNTIDSIEAIWKHKGVAAVIWYGPGVFRLLEGVKRYLLLPEYENKDMDDYQHIPAANDTGFLHEIALTPERMNDLLRENHLHVDSSGNFTDSLAKPVVLQSRLNLSFTVHFQPVQAPNVIGVLPGRDTSLPCIVVSAHHDHQGKQANGIYYGAVDNASGTVALMEMAALLNKALTEGYRPKRTIVFASFTGEEKGMLGSFYYVKHPLYAMSKTQGIMNIDMMGRVDTFYSGRRADSNYAYILVMDSTREFRNSLYKANDALTHLKLDTYYEQPENMPRRLTGSDQFPFYQQGVPFVRIDCGFAKEYHLPTDTPDKIDYPLLTRQTQLAFLTLWNMADN